MESSDDFVGVHPEHDFQIVQVRGAPPGGSTEGLDWGARQRAPPGGSIGELDWGARFGSIRCTNSTGLPGGLMQHFRFCLAAFHRWALWCGGSGAIHYPPATDLAGGRSPNVEGDHWSGVG